MRTSKSRVAVLRVATLLVSLGTPALAFAQNCALCYTQAAGAGSRMISALRSGILTLVIPPMIICVGITWMAYKKRNQFNEGPFAAEDGGVHKGDKEVRRNVDLGSGAS